MTIGWVSLYERLERELVDARRRRDELALSTLGLLKSEVVRATKEPGAGAADDALVIRVAQRELKRREEGPQGFGQVMKAATARLGGRAEGGRIAATVKRLLA